MQVTDWLGDGGVWFHVNSDHHVMALVDKGYLALPPLRLRHGRRRQDARPARPSRPARPLARLGPGPTRHRGQHRELRADRRGGVLRRALLRHGADPAGITCRACTRTTAIASNTWGPLPPRSYFRFDAERGRVRAREPRDPRPPASAMKRARYDGGGPRPGPDEIRPLQGYSLPRSPEGRASLVPPPPWHYVGDFLVLEYWADPAAVAAVLPAGLEPHPEDPGGPPRCSSTGSRAPAPARSCSIRRAASTRSSSSS